MYRSVCTKVILWGREPGTRIKVGMEPAGPTMEEMNRLSGAGEYMRQTTRFGRVWPEKDEQGESLVEVLIGMVLSGLVAVSLLGGIGTGAKATSIVREQTNAESLARR